MGDERFFEVLNQSRADADDGWGDYGAAWDAARFEEGLNAPARSDLRGSLVSDLLETHFHGYQRLATGQQERLVSLDDGLAALSRHAQRLGYDALILFLDELILWLASRMADHRFVSHEGQKVAKLVESASADRPVPIVSFIARQRDLRELVGDLRTVEDEAARLLAERAQASQGATAENGAPSAAPATPESTSANGAGQATAPQPASSAATRTTAAESPPPAPQRVAHRPAGAPVAADRAQALDLGTARELFRDLEARLQQDPGLRLTVDWTLENGGDAA